MLARVLAGRDVEIDAVEDFLDPTIRKLMPDPFTVTQMEAAARRIADAAVRGEQVAIFGDYDVDGATSAALLAWLGIRIGETRLANLWKSNLFADTRWTIWTNVITLVPSFPVAGSGLMNLHVLCHYGRNSHHMIEAVFKATARALRQAVERDPRVSGVPSSKGVL